MAHDDLAVDEHRVDGLGARDQHQLPNDVDIGLRVGKVVRSG